MDAAGLPVVDAPLLGEPLAVELANTLYAVRGQRQEGLPTVASLAAWLNAVRDRLTPRPAKAALLKADASDLTAAHELRAAIRGLAEAAITGRRPPAAALERLNTAARRAPRWRELRWAAEPSAETRTEAAPIPAALAGIAESAVELFTGPELEMLRACQGPGCVLLFVKNHQRREWCSPACGNRARAARHYEHVRRV